MMDEDLMNKKMFSLNDLLAAGLITKKDIDAWVQYQWAKKFVTENFKGMF